MSSMTDYNTSGKQLLLVNVLPIKYNFVGKIGPYMRDQFLGGKEKW